MLVISIVAGLVLYGLIVWSNIRTTRSVSSLPRAEALRYILVRYYLRMIGLTVLLGITAWVLGAQFCVGVLGSMVLGNLIFLVANGFDLSWSSRLVNGQEKVS
ncbi:MAG: hypothetical protein ACM3UZ_08360 [Acidobacteriota bacterium]